MTTLLMPIATVSPKVHSPPSSILNNLSNPSPNPRSNGQPRTHLIEKAQYQVRHLRLLRLRILALALVTRTHRGLISSLLLVLRLLLILVNRGVGLIHPAWAVVHALVAAEAG